MDPKKWKLYESAFIKSIRRCLVDDAIYWGMLLYKLGRAEGVWRRMFIHLSEDIGIAERELPANIESLYRNYKLLQQDGDCAYESEGTDRLPFVHAIMLMATAKKSRAVDHAVIVHSEDSEREVPDYAIDMHSPAGRRKGRGVTHFFHEAAKLNNTPEIWPSDYERTWVDPWYHKANKILKEKEANQPSST